MKKLSPLLFFVLTLSLSNISKASHMMGGDMSYQCLGNGKYKITAKIYRDCRGISFSGPSFGVFAGTNGGNGCGSSGLSISRTGIKDVTPRCSTASSPCSPQNTYGTGEGIEEHTYEVTVDFTKSPLSGYVNKSTCCEVTFYIGQCCRNGAITTGPSNNDFYTTCMINICNIKKTTNKCNSSPTLSNAPIGFLCCNQAYYFNNGAIDTVDYDSFSYGLTNGISGLPNSSVSYSSPFTARYFMTPYCIPPTSITCTPNPKTNPPRGLFFDTSSGDIILTPTKCDEVAIAVITITEWRKDSATSNYLCIGKTRRELEFIVRDNCGYNKPPKLVGPFYWAVCEGDTLKVRVETEDETFSPYQVVPDTTTLTWNSVIPGATFTVAKKANWPEERLAYADFEWCPKPGMADDNLYYFTARVTDNHCPNLATSIRSFAIRVRPRVVLKVTAIDSVNCFQGSDGSITTSIAGGSKGFQYQWNDPTKQLSSKASNLKKGIYKLIAKDIYGCSDSITGTVNEPAKVVLTITAIDSVNCFQGADGSITTSTAGGSNGFKYQWNDPSKQTVSNASDLKKGIYKLIASDMYGCSDSITGAVNEPAKVVLTITVIDSVNCFQGSDVSISTSVEGGSKGYVYQWNDPNKQTSSKAINLKKGVYKLIAKDVYGCSDSITGIVDEPSKVVISVTAIDSVNCFQGSDGSITTSTAGGSKGFKYQWNDPSKQTASKASNLKKGIYKLVARDIYGCSDSVIVTVNEPAKVIISFTNIDSASCYGYSDGSIATTTKGGTGSYKWKWDTSPSQMTSEAIGLKKGDYVVIVEDVYGCSDSITGTVYEPEKIVPKITMNRLTMLGMSHELYADITPVKKYQYFWTPLITFNGLYTQFRPRVIFNETTKIGLMVTDFKGCKGYDTAIIKVVQPIRMIIPTGFTPNVDNLNEGFGLPDIFEIQSLEIFDRWGGMIFIGSSTTPRWDGRLNGELVPAGVYAYTIQARLKGTDQIVKHGGRITLIK
jgi:gliding motility-associated-like protein